MRHLTADPIVHICPHPTHFLGCGKPTTVSAGMQQIMERGKLISVFTAIGTRVPFMKTGQGGNWLPLVLGPMYAKKPQ
jgi:hypothetical protein